MKILKRSEPVEKVEYTFNFDSIKHPGSGLAFPCDQNGMLFPFECEEAATNYKQGYLSGLYHAPYIQKYEWQVIKPFKIECDCGRVLHLWSETNECGYCGRLWSQWAQRLAPIHFWGEETGEHPADVARSF
jgi:hypothetical protein